MENFCWSLLCVLFFSTTAKGVSYPVNQSCFYAGLASTLAKYYNSACTYFLTDSRDDDSIFLEKVMKEVSYINAGSTNIFSFDEYHDHMSKGIIQCYLPLQVVISHDEATRVAFAEHSQRSRMHGSDSAGGGVWLVFLDSLSKEYIEQYFDGIKTPFDVQLIVAELKRNDVWKLKEVYRVREDRPLRYPDFGKWSPETGLIAPTNIILHSRRSDLEGIIFQVGYVESAPFTQLEKVDGKEVLGGYMGDIWEVLEDALNVTTNLTLKKHYGVHSDSGNNWTGLIQQVHVGNLDVGIADFSLTQKRFEAISYSSPLLMTSFQVYYQSAGSTIEADALFLPLAEDIWISLLCWLLLSATFLYLGCYLSDKNFETDENLTFPNAMFFVAGALCAQGGVHIPKRFTCRVLFIASFLITAVVIPSYSASLMSYLTVLPPVILFSNMKQFYELGNVRMTVKDGSYEYDLFSYESSNDPYMNKIFRRDILTLPKDDYPRSNQLGIRGVCHSKQLAFFGLSDAVKWAINQEERLEGFNRSCVVSHMPFDAGKVSVGMIFPKDSHFRGIINHHLSYLPTTGVLKRLRNKHWPIAKGIKSQDEHNAVGLNNLFMMFVILGSGVAIALGLFLCELKTGRRRLKPMKKSPKNCLKTSDVLCPEAMGKFSRLRRRPVAGSLFDYYY